MALRIEQSTKPSPAPIKRNGEEEKKTKDAPAAPPSGSPNDIVRAATAQPGPQPTAAVPLNQILTPNQVVKTNVSHAAAGGAH